MSIQAFREMWTDLAQDQRNLKLENAIHAWIIRLDLPSDISKHINQFINNIWKWLYLCRPDFNKMISIFLDELSFFIKIGKNLTTLVSPESDYIKAINSGLVSIRRRNQVKLVLLIAFVLSGVGIMLFFLDQRSKSLAAKPLMHPSYALPTQTVNAQARENFSLILLINSDEQEVIKSLVDRKSLTEEISDDVCYASRYLWQGAEQDSLFSEIMTSFEGEGGNKDHEESEYDVYLVHISLPELMEGLERNKTLPERLDAFRQLAEKKPAVRCSPRLSSDEYSAEGFYRR